MKFNEILEFARKGDIIQPQLWKTETVFNAVAILEDQKGNYLFLLNYKDGFWTAKVDTNFLEKFDDWKILS